MYTLEFVYAGTWYSVVMSKNGRFRANHPFDEATKLNDSQLNRAIEWLLHHNEYKNFIKFEVAPA